jgi:Mg-chelatase subunit ChlD
MKTIERALLALGILVGLLYPHLAANAAGNKERITIVVLDQSGSMRLDLPEKKPRAKASDPLGLRCSAVRLLADLATTRDSLGLVKLESHDDKTGPAADRTAEVLLAPMAMGTAQSRDAFKTKVVCDQATNNTPIADALRKAYELLAAARRERGGAFDGRVILLTDGDPQPQREAQLQEIDQLLPQFGQESWPISTVGLKLRANNNALAINLLKKIAGVTKGHAYDDVDDPLKLQNVFVDFFAQQTGRSLLPSAAERLTPNGEARIGVADYATRIDVLVAKSNPRAAISLRRPGPDYTEVAENGPGVDLFSNSDNYYAAFSIDKPIKGVWSIRTSQPTDVIVNVLVESHIQVRLENAEAPRASNEPLLIEARFYNRQDDDAYTPAAVPNADVGATVTIGDRSYSVPLRDDGKPPDAAANDGLYAGSLTLEGAFDGPAVADVALTAKAADAEYTDHRSLQLAAVPAVALAEDASTLRLAPDSPIEVPLQLRIGQRAADPAGWDVVVRQTIAGEHRRVDVRRKGDTFLARLLPLPDDQEEYAFEADLLGVDQNAGLKRLRQPMSVRVVFQPALKLFYTPIGVMPVGWPITMSAALLKSFNTPARLRAPLQLNVQQDDGPAQPISDVQDDGRGFFAYRFVPQTPGRYRFTLLPPRDQTLDAEVQDVVVATVPEMRWQPPPAAGGPLVARAVQWPWLDRLRRVPLAGWPVDLLFPTARSELVAVEGQAWRGDQPYTGILALALLDADGAAVHTETVAGDRIAAAWDLPAGDYRLRVEFPGAFPPQLDCCRAETPITVLQIVPPADLRMFAGIVAGELLALLIAAVVAHYLLAPRPLPGDRLVFTAGGKELAVDLKGEQRFALLRPSRINLTGYFRRRGRTTPGLPKQGTVRKTRDGVEFNGHNVPVKQNKQIEGCIVRYEPSRLRNSPAPRPAGKRPAARGSLGHATPWGVRTRRSGGGPLEVLRGWLGFDRHRPRARSQTRRRAPDRRPTSAHKPR